MLLFVMGGCSSAAFRADEVSDIVEDALTSDVSPAAFPLFCEGSSFSNAQVRPLLESALKAGGVSKIIKTEHDGGSRTTYEYLIEGIGTDSNPGRWKVIVRRRGYQLCDLGGPLTTVRRVAK